MWQAMTPPNALPSYGQSERGRGPSVHASSTPNPDGSTNVYVHHINHGGPQAAQAPPPPPQMAMPQMAMPAPPMMYPMPMPYPMPAPAPPLMYPPMYGGCPPMYGQQQQCGPQYGQQSRQPTVVVLNSDPPAPAKPDKPPEKKKDPPKPKPEEKKDPPKPEEKKDDPPPPPSGPQRFSKFSIVSIIVFVLALVFGVACIVKTYEAYDARAAGLPLDDAGYVVDRTVAVGTGAAAVLCFAVATLSSFYAGMRHRGKAKARGGKSAEPHACQAGFLLAAWIIFTLTFINALIILVLAFDQGNIIYPEVVWSALIGSILSWMLMFGYSEMARRR